MVNETMILDEVAAACEYGDGVVIFLDGGGYAFGFVLCNYGQAPLPVCLAAQAVACRAPGDGGMVAVYARVVDVPVLGGEQVAVLTDTDGDSGVAFAW
jgi:hypothetical protein